MIKIKPVISKKDLKQFIMLPFELYRNDPNWVPPLIMDQKNFFNEKKNPYYEHSEVQLFLAFKDETYSQVESRYYALGQTNRNRELFIVFTVRDTQIRVISARDMSRRERRYYDYVKEE